MEFDALLLARIQFAFTISFHIIFPAFTIGLASYLAVLEFMWLKSGKDHFRDLYKFWIKIFAVAFGMGVVSGVVMSYQFGTNWSQFSDKISNVLGPLLAFEVLTAFFLEASFLGIMLFGWGRVSKGMHFLATCIVAVGTLISAFWILSANSWMHTPQGFSIAADGRLMPTNWLEIIFNPSFPYRFMHMISAGYLTTAFVVGGVAAYYLWKKRHVQHARIMLGMATIIASLLAPIQILLGDAHGLNTLKHQPAKVAAMEGLWETRSGVPLVVFALPNESERTNYFEIAIPKVTSLILTHDLNGEVKGLNEFKGNHPPVAPVFFAFRIMVGLGMMMALLGIISAVRYFQGKLFTTRWLQVWWMMMIPSGFIAIICGWCVTEIGRQPFTAYNVIRTVHSVSPAIIGPQVAWSLLSFIVMYTLVFGAGSYYIIKQIAKGLVVATEGEQFYDHSMEATVVKGEVSDV